GIIPFVKYARKNPIKSLVIWVICLALSGALVYSGSGEPGSTIGMAIGLVLAIIAIGGTIFLVNEKPLHVSLPFCCIYAVILSALSGFAIAKHDLLMNSYNFTIRAKSGSSVEAALLKAGSNFTIFQNSQRVIVVMPTADVASIERRSP